jgi:hypothetical protein
MITFAKSASVLLSQIDESWEIHNEGDNDSRGGDFG